MRVDRKSVKIIDSNTILGIIPVRSYKQTILINRIQSMTVSGAYELKKTDIVFFSIIRSYIDN